MKRMKKLNHKEKMHVPNHEVAVFILGMALSFCLFDRVGSQEKGGSFTDDPGAIANFVEDAYEKQILSLLNTFKDDIKEKMGFCIVEPEVDWKEAFGMGAQLGALTSCAQKTKGDMSNRLCSAAEIKFFVTRFLTVGARKKSKINKNCNLTSWVDGCENGWACRTDENVDSRNFDHMPLRTSDCQPCCEGFFCPLGLTCMIPCPSGAYCPSANMDQSTGICEPYNYRIPAGKPNHTCGAADTWSDVKSSKVFCPRGQFCPTPVETYTCSSGHFCRLGSTTQERCFPLATCHANSTRQNITVYGVIAFGSLSLLLILMYSCSDRVLSTRERRKAKSRERAVKSVRESRAREKWETAKDVAKKHAVELQKSISTTFSRRRSMKDSKVFDAAGGGSDASLPSIRISGRSQTASGARGRNDENNDQSEMLNENDHDLCSNEGFNIDIGDKNIKKQGPKGKKGHTQSQIFKYAYGQIEKEKAMQEEHFNWTFSGVISMANAIEIKKRPTLEIEFKDLTLTLNKTKQHILRCVTGKLSPGRITAVMGPSGAGKTTLLSALTGKTVKCTTTGSVLINGKRESIRSYKKIIGFVPQDDIVHGNLTVEENLWFSAKCRLPVELPKQDKVLVVERVVESLGLQAVRDSLVGTVETRGISGGQRKRVNVGLEMVMLPSLLILDEPTTGLDSSSSQLLLRALRRESLEGVNICMVVHQPSSTLFRMFDDFILLAKGGLTVYHGPVKKVEEYFSGLGITVPDRVNPPDYYIDVLEGIENPCSEVTAKQLPVRWMIHNGYPVPQDMLISDEEDGSCRQNPSHDGETPTGGGGSVKSTDEELWEQEKSQVEPDKKQKKNILLQNDFFKYKDLSNRVTPGVFKQYRYFLGRVAKQRLRESTTVAADYLILLLAGICLGLLGKLSDESFGFRGYQYTVIAVPLLVMIAALRTFSLDKLNYWRERASGMSSFAYFLAKDTVDHLNTFVKPMVYLSMFYFFNNPRSSFGDNYVVLLCLIYCVTGIGYILTIPLNPGAAQLWCTLLPVVMTLASTKYDNKIITQVSKFFYSKWALEAFEVANAKRYHGVWLISRCTTLFRHHYAITNWVPDLAYLMVTGVITRLIAFICLLAFQKR